MKGIADSQSSYLPPENIIYHVQFQIRVFWNHPIHFCILLLIPFFCIAILVVLKVSVHSSETSGRVVQIRIQDIDHEEDLISNSRFVL